MKLSRLILSIVMLLGFSSYAGACIINLGDGAFYYAGLNIKEPQNLVNDYLSQAWPALNVRSYSLGSETAAELREAVYKVPLLSNIMTAEPKCIQDITTPVQDNPAPVPEPATMLLIGAGLIGLAGFRTKIKKQEVL